MDISQNEDNVKTTLENRKKTRRLFGRNTKRYLFTTRPIRNQKNGFWRYLRGIEAPINNGKELDAISHSLYVRMISSAGYMTHNYGLIPGTLDYWAERLSVTRKQVKTAFNKLVSIGLIKRTGKTQNSQRFIVNYSLFREGVFNQESADDFFGTLETQGQIKCETGPNKKCGKHASIDTLSDLKNQTGPNVLQNRAKTIDENRTEISSNDSELILKEINNIIVEPCEDEKTNLPNQAHNSLQLKSECCDSIPREWVSEPVYLIPRNATIKQDGKAVRKPYTNTDTPSKQKQLRWLRVDDNFHNVIRDMFDQFCEEYPAINNEKNPFNLLATFNAFNRDVSSGAVVASDYVSAWWDFAYYRIRNYVGNNPYNNTEPNWKTFEQAVTSSKEDAFRLLSCSNEFYNIDKLPSILNYEFPDEMAQVRDALEMYYHCLHIMDRVYSEVMNKAEIPWEQVKGMFAKRADSDNWVSDAVSAFKTGILTRIHTYLPTAGFQQIGESTFANPYLRLRVLTPKEIESLLMNVFDSAEVDADICERDGESIIVRSITIENVRVENTLEVVYGQRSNSKRH